MPTDDRSYVAHFSRLAQDESRAWHDQIKHWRDLYNQNHYKVRPKPGETQYADPIYLNTVDLAVGVILSNSLDWKAAGWTPSAVEEVETSRVEKYLAGLVEINSDRNQYSIEYESLLNFVRDGAAVLYSVWDPNLAQRSLAYDPQGGKVYLEPPILLQVLDPLTIALFPGAQGRWAKIIRTVQMTPYDVELIYGVRLNKHARMSDLDRMTTKFDFQDFWEIVPTKGVPPKLQAWYERRPHMIQNAVMFDDEFIRPLRAMPGYDSLPYTVGFFKPVDRNNPKDWGHSIEAPLESSVEMLERSTNRRQRQIDVFSSLPIVVRSATGRPVAMDPGLGNRVTLGPDEDIGFPKWSGDPPDVDRHAQFLSERAQQASFPNSMFGQGAGASAGYALSQLNDMSRIRLTQPTVHLQLMFSQHARMILKLTRNFGGDASVRVYGRMRGRDFSEQVNGATADNYRVTASFKPVFPNEEVRKHAMATQVAGMLSQRTIMSTYLGIEQPDDERQQKMVEMLQEHPLMKQYALVAALTEMADGGDEAAAMVLQQMQSGTQAPAGEPGRPEEPRRMEQLQGLAGPRGLPAPQDVGQPPPGQSFLDQFANQANAAPDLAGGI